MSDRTEAMRQQRSLSSTHKLDRVVAVTRSLLERGDESAMAEIACRAEVSRNFLYKPEVRHAITAEVQATCDRLSAGLATSSRVTAASLRAELQNYKAQNSRLRDQLRQLEAKLSRVLGVAVLDELPLDDHRDVATRRGCSSVSTSWSARRSSCVRRSPTARSSSRPSARSTASSSRSRTAHDQRDLSPATVRGMTTRGLVITVAAVAVLAGGSGAAIVVVLSGGGDGTGGGGSAGGGRSAGDRVSSAQAADDLSAGMTMEFTGSSYGVNSATCEDADGAGSRFRCTVFVQRGISSGPDAALPDNGVGARYGISYGTGAEAVKIVASYSDDRETLSWSPGGGSVLIGDVRDRERELERIKRERGITTPSSCGDIVDQGVAPRRIEAVVIACRDARILADQISKVDSPQYKGCIRADSDQLELAQPCRRDGFDCTASPATEEEVTIEVECQGDRGRVAFGL